MESNNFYYNKTYNIYHYSQLCGDNIKNYRFDAGVIMDSLYNIDSKYVYSNREDVKIISYNEEDYTLTVNVYLDGGIKIESFKYDDNRDHITSVKKWDYTYDEEKDEYIGFESLNYSFYAISGKIYDEIIKWWYDVTDRSYEGMSPKDFLIIRVNRINNGDIIIYDNKNDRYIRFKIYRIKEECLTKDTPKINIKRLFLKNHLSRTNYFIDVEKTKKYAKFDKEDRVVSSIAEVKLYNSSKYTIFSVKK